MDDEPAREAAAGPLRFRWRIHPRDKPGETAAELVFTQEPDAETGSLEITAADADMKALVFYFLSDPFGHRPLFFRDKGTVYGPHTRTFGQIDRSLLDFNRQYPGFRAVRESPFPGAQAPAGGEAAEA